MDVLTRAMTWVLGRSIGFLSPGRRVWGEALQAEAGSVPSGRARLAWLAGALQVVAKEAHMVRKIGSSALVLSGAAAVLWFGWRGGSSTPADRANRVQLVATLAMLAALPLLVRSRFVFGPVAPNPAARVVRVVGYLAVCALLPIGIGVGVASGRFQACDGCVGVSATESLANRQQQVVINSIILAAVMAASALIILWLTSSRSQATRTTLATGAGIAALAALIVYALAPTGALTFSGFWPGRLSVVTVCVVVVGAPLLAGLLSVRHSSAPGGPGPADGAMTQGLAAGLLTGTMGVLLLATLTIPTMLALPHRVTLEWANPDPTIPHGTVEDVQMSVGDAAIGYEAYLILGPFVGAMLGMVSVVGSMREPGKSELPAET